MARQVWPLSVRLPATAQALPRAFQPGRFRLASQQPPEHGGVENPRPDFACEPRIGPGSGQPPAGLLGRQRRQQAGVIQLAAGIGQFTFQVFHHGQHVARLPGLGNVSQDVELGRQALAGQKIIHAPAVVLQQSLGLGFQGPETLVDPGVGLQVFLPDIQVQGTGPEYLGQPSARRPALAIHLEKPVLGVDETDGEEQVAAQLGLDRGHAMRIAVDLHRLDHEARAQDPLPHGNGGLEKEIADHGGQQQQGKQAKAYGLHDFHGSPEGIIIAFPRPGAKPGAGGICRFANARRIRYNAGMEKRELENIGEFFSKESGSRATGKKMGRDLLRLDRQDRPGKDDAQPVRAEAVVRKHRRVQFLRLSGKPGLQIAFPDRAELRILRPQPLPGPRPGSPPCSRNWISRRTSISSISRNSSWTRSWKRAWRSPFPT